jgi:hypothetical protein
MCSTTKYSCLGRRIARQFEGVGKSAKATRTTVRICIAISIVDLRGIGTVGTVRSERTSQWGAVSMSLPRQGAPPYREILPSPSMSVPTRASQGLLRTYPSIRFARQPYLPAPVAPHEPWPREQP